MDWGRVGYDRLGSVGTLPTLPLTALARLTTALPFAPRSSAAVISKAAEGHAGEHACNLCYDKQKLTSVHMMEGPAPSGGPGRKQRLWRCRLPAAQSRGCCKAHTGRRSACQIKLCVCCSMSIPASSHNVLVCHCGRNLSYVSVTETGLRTNAPSKCFCAMGSVMCGTSNTKGCPRAHPGEAAMGKLVRPERDRKRIHAS